MCACTHWHAHSTPLTVPPAESVIVVVDRLPSWVVVMPHSVQNTGFRYMYCG